MASGDGRGGFSFGRAVIPEVWGGGSSVGGNDSDNGGGLRLGLTRGGPGLCRVLILHPGPWGEAMPP